MKVSDVIKTPVGVFEVPYLHEIQYGVETEDDVSVIEASLIEEEATAIAHSINSHDALVDMVRRQAGLLSELYNYIPFRNDERDDEFAAIQGEADELLKGEQ